VTVVLLGRSVKVIIGGVTALGLGVVVRCVASLRRRLPAMCVNPLNHIHAVEQTIPGVGHDLDQ